MMKIKEEISLVRFNERVLYQGEFREVSEISYDFLKNLLNFNLIFISNMDEVFSKYNNQSLVNWYATHLNMYCNNINTIKKKINILDKFIQFADKKDYNNFERRLISESLLKDELRNLIMSDEEFYHRFKNDELYFVSILKNGTIMLTTISDKSLLSKKIVTKSSNTNMYWDIEELTRLYIEENYECMGTIVCKFTTAKDNSFIVKKVDYNGPSHVMDYFISKFNDDIPYVYNPYLSLDSLKTIINEKIIESKKEDIIKYSIKDVIEKDVLIDYPKDSFKNFLNILNDASTDNNVESINLSIYRVGDDPSLFYILRNAVNNGIEVNVNVEVNAYGENINKFWISELINIGVNVKTYAYRVLKVHTKFILIKYQDGTIISNIATGNYNSKTSTQYTDLSLFTADAEIGENLKSLYDVIFTGSGKGFTDDLLVTGYNCREELVRLIREQSHSNGRIIIKCNSINDTTIINELENASRNGCEIKMVVRGICTWLPSRLNKNVEIISHVWNKLEHSRIFLFGKEDPVVYIGSLDLMTHKLDKRIETMVKIKRNEVKLKILNILDNYIYSTVKWRMSDSGEYERIRSCDEL